MNRENSIFNTEESEDVSQFGFSKEDLYKPNEVEVELPTVVPVEEKPEPESETGLDNKEPSAENLPTPAEKAPSILEDKERDLVDSYNEKISSLKEEIRALESGEVSFLKITVKGQEVSLKVEDLVLIKEEEIRKIERKRAFFSAEELSEEKTEAKEKKEEVEDVKEEPEKEIEQPVEVEDDPKGAENLDPKIEELEKDRGAKDNEEPEQKTAFANTTRKAKSIFEVAGSTLRFLSERKKGLMTFGYWEVRQAEKLRSASNEVDKKVKKMAEAFHPENNLDLTIKQRDRNELEAKLMFSKLVLSGEKVVADDGQEKLVQDLSVEEQQRILDRARTTVSWKQFEQNEEIEDVMIEKAVSTLEEKLKTKIGRFNLEAKTFAGDKVLTPEKIATLKKEMRKSIQAMRRSQVDKDVLKFNQLVRKNLDPHWYKRYVAGGIEAALALGAFHYWVAPSISSALKGNIDVFSWWNGEGSSGGGSTASFESGTGFETEGVTTGGEKLTQTVGEVVADKAVNFDVKMEKTVWDSTLDFLSKNGVDVSKLSESDKLDLVKKVAESNNIKVEAWGLDGATLDTKMQKGFGLNMKDAFDLALKKGLLKV